MSAKQKIPTMPTINGKQELVDVSIRFVKNKGWLVTISDACDVRGQGKTHHETFMAAARNAADSLEAFK